MSGELLQMLTVASTGFSMRDLLPRQETESLPLPRGVAAANCLRERKRQLPTLLRDGPFSLSLSRRLRMPFAGAEAARGKR